MTKLNPSPESGEGESTWLCMQSRFLTAFQTIEGGGKGERVMDREAFSPLRQDLSHYRILYGSAERAHARVEARAQLSVL